VSSKKITWLWFAILAGLFFFMFSTATDLKNSANKNISFSQMLNEIKIGKTADTLTITGNMWVLETEEIKFISRGILTDNILSDIILKRENLELIIKPTESGSMWGSLLLSLLPTLLLLVVFYFIYRAFSKGAGKGGPALNMTDSKARVFMPGSNEVRFEDVAGCDEAKEELEEVISFLRNPAYFTRLGGKLPKGILLTGKPGTGKTMLAKAVAGEAGVPFLVISGSDFVEMYVGVGAARVRSLFTHARKMAPCIIFIDELDAMAKKRAMKLGGSNDEKEQTLNQLLVEMDGFSSDSGIIIIAATNRKDVLDDAVLRPGRFDRLVPVPLPDAGGRQKVLEVHGKNFVISEDVELHDIARSCVGFSGAELANLLNEAAIHAAIQGADIIREEHLEYAKDKLILGKPRKSMRLTDKQYRATAVHEAGHAIVAQFTEGSDPLHKVTIIPRDMALGLTVQLPREDRYSTTRGEAEGRIDVLLGGYVAEELVFGKDNTSTGVSNDLERARTIAEGMVKKYGMSEMGPLAYLEDPNSFSGSKYSDSSESRIDDLVSDIIGDSYDRVRELIKDKMMYLNIMSDILMEYKTIDKEQIEAIFEEGTEV